MRISPRTALRTLTGAAILGFGALVFSPASAEAHGYRHHGWYGPPHHAHGWHGRPYWAPRPVYSPYRYYAPRPRVVVVPPPYYAPRPYATYYRGW